MKRDVKAILYATVLFTWLVLLSIGLALGPWGLEAQAPALSTADEASQLRQVLAQQIDALGRCNAQLGPLQQLQAQAVSGKLVEPATVIAQVKAQFEKANPGKTLTETFVVTDAPKRDGK